MGKTFALPAGMRGDAKFSDIARRRLFLRRWWESDNWNAISKFEKLLVIGHNPSEAGADRNDPTTLRIASLCQQWGYRGFVLHNLTTWIGDDPKAMKHKTATELRSSTNIVNIITDSQNVSAVLCAWGKVEAKGMLGIPDNVELALRHAKLFCIGRNKDGSPKHPMYSADGVQLQEYGSSSL